MENGIFYSHGAIFEMDMSAYAKLVYFYLCRRADMTGKSYPSKKTIAKDCGVGVSTVDKAIRELKSLGLLRAYKRFKDNKKRSNMYKVLPPSDTMLTVEEIKDVKKGNEKVIKDIDPALVKAVRNMSKHGHANLSVTDRKIIDDFIK